MPSRSPTLGGYSCFDVINDYTQTFRKVKVFDEVSDGVAYLTAYDECGISGQLEYYYKFRHIAKTLNLYLIVCCGENSIPASFGASYPIPTGYEPNQIIQANLGVDDINDIIPDRNETIRNIIFYSILGLVFICIIIGSYLIYW